MFREKALHIAEKLLPAFNTLTGIPHALINIGTGVRLTSCHDRFQTLMPTFFLHVGRRVKITRGPVVVPVSFPNSGQ